MWVWGGGGEVIKLGCGLRATRGQEVANPEAGRLAVKPPERGGNADREVDRTVTSSV